MIEIEHLSKTFQPPRGAPVPAVKDASFSVRAGEVFGLLGPNGAGKTTLLRMLGTIVPPTSGRVLIDGRDTAEAGDDIRKEIGFLSGNTRLYGRLTARELLRYFGNLYGMTDELIAARTDELAGLLDMREFLDRRCEGLSTGQTQKVSISRVILHDPKVLILDEPTLGLDIMTSRTILDFVEGAAARGHCIIFSTHYMMEAERLCDRIGLIHQGEIMSIGTLDELRGQTGANDLHNVFLHFVDSKEPASA